MLEHLYWHYQNADGNAPFDTEDWKYLVETWDMGGTGFRRIGFGSALRKIGMDQETSRRRSHLLPTQLAGIISGEGLNWGWTRFSKAIKHEMRFLFFREESEDDGGEPFLIRPAEMLEELGTAIRRCRLVTTLKSGMRL